MHNDNPLAFQLLYYLLGCRKLIYSNKMLYAFVYHGTDYGLWAKRATQTMDTKEWTEVTSLLDVPMFSYLELRKYAQAIGWIEEDNHNWLIEGI